MRLLETKRVLFQRFVVEYRKKIMNLSYDLTGNLADAEDLCQEVFLKAYRSLDSFREEASLYTWLYRIAVTTFIDQRRKKSSQAALMTQPFDEANGVADPSLDQGGAVNPEQRFRLNRTTQLIEKAMQDLSAKERSAFTLKHQSGLSISEIALAMQIAPGTVKSFLFRATQKLRNALGGGAGESRRGGSDGRV